MNGLARLLRCQTFAGKLRVQTARPRKSFVRAKNVRGQIPDPSADDRAGGEGELDPLCVPAGDHLIGFRGLAGHLSPGDVDGRPGKPHRSTCIVVDQAPLALDPAERLTWDGQAILHQEIGTAFEGGPDVGTQGVEVLWKHELLVFLHRDPGGRLLGIKPVKPGEIGVTMQKVGVDHPVPQSDDT